MANEFKIKHGFVSTGDGTVEGEIRVSGIAYAENGSRLATRAYISQFLTDNNYVVTGDLPTNISAFTNDSGYLTSYTETDTLATVVARGQSTGRALVVTAVDSGNPSAAANSIRLSGYGVLGNRGTFYLTNGGGVIQIGVGASHNDNPLATFADTGISFERAINVNGNITANNLRISNWDAAYDRGDHAGLYDTAGTGAAEAGAVNTRIDEEILPAIDSKSDSSHVHDDRYLQLTGGTLSGDLQVLLNDHSTGPGWDTQLYIGKSDTLGLEGAFPTYVPAGSYGFFSHASSDGVFIGSVPVSAGAANYYATIAWGDDATEYLQFLYKGSKKAHLTTEGHFYINGNLYANGGNSTEWNTAFGWGDHASVGYLTAVPSEYLTQTEGDARYLQSLPSHNHDTLYDALGSAAAVDSRIDTEVLPSIPTNNNQLTNGAGYITDGNTGWNNTYGFITASSTNTLTNKSGNISQWTNDSGYITDGNTGWNNSYGFITASSTDTLTNKSGNISQWTNDSGYITDGNTGWNNTYGFITGLNWTDLGGDPADINVSQFTNDAGYITDGNQGWDNTYGFITASASITGNAATATKLATARTISLGGDVTGSANFDGSANITVTATVANDSHTHDGRYYTESESDARFVNVTGDNVTGDLSVSGASLSVTSTADGSEAFFVDGVNGRLFTITDSLSDSLFSVNTISGLPVIEAFSDNTVKLGPFSNPVTIDAAGVLAIGGVTAATQTYVDTAVNNIIGGAPGALDTLNELAAAINDDASFASSVTTSLSLKAPLASPALTGTPTAPTAATSTNSTQIATTAFVKAQGYVTTDTNYYLNGITRSGNVLTFSVNGATNQTYTFGSAAWVATTAFDAAGTGAAEAGVVNTRIDSEVLPLIQTPAITSNGSTPSLNTGITAAEVRSLIGAGTSSSDTNYYLSGASFNTGDGVLTLTVSGATNQTVDLDGRYLTSLPSHNHDTLYDSIGSADAVNTRIDTEVLPAIPTVPTNVSAFTNDAGYITDGNTNWNNSYGFITASSNITGNAATATTATNLGTYYTADTWFRATSDNNTVKFYGNSRMMVFRTDGEGGDTGHTGYAFKWTYGGDATGNSLMLLDNNGNLWTKSYGWLHSRFDAAGTAATEAGTVNTRIDEEVLPLIGTPAITSNGSTPSLNTGISAAEVRSLIGAQASGSYLTSYSETDTLATVTARDNTTSGAINVNGDILLTGSVTSTNQGRMIDFTGFDKEGTTDFSDRAYIQHTTATGGHSGSVLVISSQNDSGDGIAFLTNASSKLKHNSNNIATENWVSGLGYITEGVADSRYQPIGSYLTTTGKAADSDLLDGINSSSFVRSDVNDTVTGVISFNAGINTLSINDTSGQQLVICAGEAGIDASQNGELVYVNAENGFQVAASNDNWATGYAGTKKTIIDYGGIRYDGNYVWHTGNFNPSSYQAAGTYNTIIGTDSDINTSGATIIDNIYVTDGVITSMGTRTLTQADLGIPTNTVGNWWNGGYVPVGTDGVTEVGKYIDFHDTDTGTSDFSYRITNSGDRLYFGGDIEVDGGDLYLNDGNTRLHEGNNNMLRVSTNSGYIEIGPANTSHCHIQTDRSNFYFNTEIRVDTGIIGSYNEDLQLRRAGSTKITLGTSVTTFANYITVPQPTPPTFSAANIVGETIEIVFEQSGTSGVDAYQVWSSVNNGSYGLIANIPTQDIAATMTAIDAVFSVSGDQAYRVYAIKNGIYSDPAEGSVAYTASGIDVVNMSVVNLNTAYYIQYDMPASRFVDHIEIYMDAEDSSGSLSRTGATLVYSGNNTNYMYQIAAADMNKFHQFWVEVIES